jgi:hypothetical protein
MLSWLKLSHYSHSWKLRPHEHTSYFPLLMLLLVVGISLTTLTSYAQSPPPALSSVGLSGTVPADPPTQGATVQSPNNLSHFSATPITISGECPKSTIIQIFKNDIFAGSTPCKDDKTFSMQIDLLIGENTIFAKVYDALNQTGPDSSPITVYYDALPNQSPGITTLDFSGAQLLLNTDGVFRGVFPNQELKVPIDVLGGTLPVAVNILWGDSTNKVVPRNSNQGFTEGHVYTKPGTYQISLQASDANGKLAFLSVAAIVNGQPNVLGTVSTSSNSKTDAIIASLFALWPLYTGAVAVVISYWYGERREKKLLSKHGLLLPQ